MNILVISREFPPHVLGGISYHLSNLYSEISDLGHSVTVVSGKVPGTESISQEIVSDDISTHFISYGSRSGHLVRFSWRLYRFLSRFDLSQFDIALAHTPIPFELSIPTVTKYHDCEQEERKTQFNMGSSPPLVDQLYNPIRRLIEQRSLNCTDGAIFNSNLNREAWSEHYNVGLTTTVHHNGVDTDIFYPREAASSDYLLFVGDSERKGLSDVIKFASESDRPVYVAGNVPDKDGIRVLGRVSQDELATLYSGAAATIHPTKFEAFGNIILESLACGTPVITTSSCGASEVLSDQNGIITNDLSDGVQKLTETRFSKENCVRVAQEHSWRQVAKSTVEFASHILSRC